MTRTSLELWRRGHLPVMGEWFALPLIEAAVAGGVDEADADTEIFHPIAERLLERCDGCLRIGGASEGADRMVHTAERLGKAVWHAIDEVPSPSFKAALSLSGDRRTAVHNGWRVQVWLDHELTGDGVRVGRGVEIRSPRPIEPGAVGEVEAIPFFPETWRPISAGEELDLIEPPTHVVATLRVLEGWRS